MPDGVILGEEHTALMFIATKCPLIDQLDRVKDEIIKGELGDSLQFVGKCFGKFDIIVEFREDSAKVASYKACTVQEKASQMVQEEFNLKDAICSSLVLCNEFKETKGKERSTSKDMPIRFYSLFIPKSTHFNLDKVLQEVKDNMRLLFSSSYFTFLLIISGNNFFNVFDDFTNFRENTVDFFYDSSTYVTIEWDKEDKPLGDRKIQANVLLKLEDGFGDIEDIKRGNFIKHKWKRFGSFDISLLIEADTLFEMKEKIYEVRSNEKVSHTSTPLLVEVENETNED
jgi:hypothetical protein